MEREDRNEDRTRQWLYILGGLVWVILLVGAFSSGSGGGVILVIVIGIAAFLAFSKGEPAGSASRAALGKDEAGRFVLRAGSDEPISEAARSQRLDEEIATYAREGFSLQQRTATTAQMVKPKRFSLLWALVWFLMLGVGLVVYLLYYAAKRDEGRYVEVDEYGTVKATLQ